LEVRVHRNKRGFITSFEVKGHADYAEHGSDIVCAGVSALTQAAVLGLQQVCGLKIQMKKAPGDMECRLPAIGTPEQYSRGQAILESMILGLRGIEEEYGDYLVLIETFDSLD